MDLLTAVTDLARKAPFDLTVDDALALRRCFGPSTAPPLRSGLLPGHPSRRELLQRALADAGL